MIRCLILFIIIMVCYASTAAAQGLSGAILYQDCAALSNTTEYAVCISYLRGFTEGLFAGDHGRASGLPYCGPASMDMSKFFSSRRSTCESIQRNLTERRAQICLAPF